MQDYEHIFNKSFGVLFVFRESIYKNSLDH